MNVLLFANVGTDTNGYYHVGDEAMFTEVADFYKTHFKQARLSAFVSMPLKYGGITEVRGIGWPDTREQALKYFLTSSVKIALYSWFGISFLNNEQQRFTDVLKQQDLIHFSGGGNITSECKHWFYYALFVAFSARILGKKVLLTSQTIGPFSNWIDRLFAVAVLNTVQSIALREHSHTQEKKLRKSGLYFPKIYHSLDFAYFLKPASKYKGIPKKDSHTVRIGLSLHSKKNFNLLKKILTETLVPLVEKRKNIELLLVPHMSNTVDDWDAAFMRKITKGFSKNIPIHIPRHTVLSENKAPLSQVIKAVTQTCDIVLTSRYHGAIFGLSEGVPSISLVDGEYQQMKNYEATRFLFDDYASAFVVNIRQKNAVKKCSRILETTLVYLPHLRQYLRKKNRLLKGDHAVYLRQLSAEITYLTSRNN